MIHDTQTAAVTTLKQSTVLYIILVAGALTIPPIAPPLLLSSVFPAVAALFAIADYFAHRDTKEETTNKSVV